MIKNMTKLAIILIITGVMLTVGATACQSARPKDVPRDNWQVDWSSYRPDATLPNIDVELPQDNNSGGEKGNGGEENTPAQVVPAVEPVLYTAMIKSLTDRLNVRLAPSMSGRVIGSLDRGDMVRYEGEQNGWYKTVYKQQSAYVYAGGGYADVVYMKQGSEAVESVIAVGEELLGYPYVWGSQRYHWGNGALNSNFVQGEFDCSALMQYIFFKGAGVLMDLNTRTQVLQGKTVDISDLQRGDVMFFTNDSRVGKTGVERVGHVALYLGDNYILHTASDHAVIEEISAKRQSYFIVAKRFL